MTIELPSASVSDYCLDMLSELAVMLDASGDRAFAEALRALVVIRRPAANDTAAAPRAPTP